MGKKQTAKSSGSAAQQLLAAALALPNVEEGIACAGTSLEKRTIKVCKKAFLFLSANDVMLKLADSLPAATKLAAAEPERYKVGAHGWTTIQIADTKGLSLPQMKKWIAESYQLFAASKKK
jgi:hypothetical protein